LINTPLAICQASSILVWVGKGREHICINALQQGRHIRIVINVILSNSHRYFIIQSPRIEEHFTDMLHPNRNTGCTPNMRRKMYSVASPVIALDLYQYPTSQYNILLSHVRTSNVVFTLIPYIIMFRKNVDMICILESHFASH